MFRNFSYDPLNRLDTYNPGTSTRFVYVGLRGITVTGITVTVH